MANNVVIVYARRTAIGRLCGNLGGLPAPRLGASLVQDALKHLDLDAQTVDEIIMGQVLQAGSGQAPARQAALFGGLPNSVPATTLNKVCGSGLKAIMLGAQAVALGDAQVVFAGGQESMSLAPHLLPKSRWGYRLGAVTAIDHLQYDGLIDPYNNIAMGNCGELCAREMKISREAQDDYALESYARARKASESGLFRDEIVSVAIENKRECLQIGADEEPFAAKLEKLRSLKPVFDSSGTITAGNASSINDGAALLVLMAEDYAHAHNYKPMARIIGSAVHACDPSWFTTAPISGIRKLLKGTATKIEDIDLFEVNEAFAVVPIAAMRELNISHSRLNVHGGSVALGHPIGASGARIIVTLLGALKASNKRTGLASICIGGGESCNMLVERID